MKKKPLVTILILVYNNADGLEDTISSVLAQDFVNAEVILSDDGSSNYNTCLLEDYAKRLRSKFESVRVNVNEKNLGTVKHLNRVIRMAEGSYIINCCSGDSFYAKNTISHLVSCFKKSGKRILSARRLDVYPDGKTKKRPSVLIGCALKLCPKALMEYMICNKNLLSGCCTFAAKELFETYGYYDEDYFLVEDYPYYVELLRKKEPFAVTFQPAIRHGIGGVSTGKVHPAIYEDIEKMREKLYFHREDFPGKVQKFLEQSQKNSKT